MIYGSDTHVVLPAGRNQFVMAWTGVSLDLWKPVGRPSTVGVAAVDGGPGSAFLSELPGSRTKTNRRD